MYLYNMMTEQDLQIHMRTPVLRLIDFWDCHTNTKICECCSIQVCCAITEICTILKSICSYCLGL